MHDVEPPQGRQGLAIAPLPPAKNVADLISRVAPDVSRAAEGDDAMAATMQFRGDLRGVFRLAARGGGEIPVR